MQKITIFKTSIYSGILKDIDNILLEKEIENIYLNDPIKAKGVKKSNEGGWQSDLMSIDDYKMCPEIQKVFENLAKFTSQVAREWELGTDTIDFTGAWVNINAKNQFNWPHIHTGNTLSMVYYVRCNDNSGNLVFERPDPLKLCFVNKTVNENTNTAYTFSPVPGSFVIFPSYLSHYVTPNYSDDYRISIALNAYVS